MPSVLEYLSFIRMKALGSLAILLLFTLSNGFHLPAYFQNGMVLQAENATIWGFLDGNPGNISAEVACILKNGEVLKMIKTSVSRIEVRV